MNSRVARPTGAHENIKASIDAETLPPDPGYDDIGIHMSPSGHDVTGDGTETKPYRSIQYVLDEVAAAGSTLILHGGTYNETVRIRDRDITLRSKMGEQATIQTPVDDESIQQTIRIDVDADGCSLQRLEIIGGYYYAVKLETRWEWGDPNDRTGVSNVLLQDCIIHDSGRDCVKVTPECDDVVITRCEIYNSGKRDGRNAEGIDNVNGDRMTVRDCFIHDTATTGVYFKGGAIGCIIERTKVLNCGGLGIALGYDTSPEWFDLTVNSKRFESIDGIVRNCLISNTKYAGVGMYCAKDSKVLSNTLIDTALGGQNPIHFGVAFQDWAVSGEGGYRPPCENPVLMNNLVFQSQ